MAEYILASQNGRTIPTEDAIFGVNTRASQCIREYGKGNVIDATIGKLLDDQGNLLVLASVDEVYRSLKPEEYANYAPIAGTPGFRKAAIQAALKNNTLKRIPRACAAPGGTGALRLAVGNYSSIGDTILTTDWHWGPYGKIAGEIGYPVMVRPPYVLGGRGMEVVHDDEMMKVYMAAAVGVTPDRPILIDRFLNHATECEADAISDGEHCFVPAVMEHIELAGVHSGDSACILPSKNLTEKQVATIKEYTKKIAVEMNVRGLMNMQYAIEGDTVYVLEANPRASRTVPLVSKVCDINMVRIATQIITAPLTGKPSPVPELKDRQIDHYGVKEAVFPFNMFQEVDPVLGPEMRSTGEVLGISKSFGEAYYKAQEATKSVLPEEGTVLLSVCDRDKPELLDIAKSFNELGFNIIATGKSYEMIKEAGIPCKRIYKMYEGRPNIADEIANGEIQLIINTPAGKTSAHDDSYIRKRPLSRTASLRSSLSRLTTLISTNKKSSRKGAFSCQELDTQGRTHGSAPAFCPSPKKSPTQKSGALV